ncbi:hypothetical protein NDU88_010750 [Pleurodeles waltl]|uniref:Gypsy retrotransposon integrase-like protein 1 n=1 Tax=Pleurodeles waltl TaxID=8319 RepID=A0AAV7RZ40_PLEWA|nr:hypothetical protein NDU88_010750 [Pleurodeles waltl]
MAYFNPRKRTEVVVDASPVGLGAVHLQEQHHQEWTPVAYASRALSAVETRYAQIEREALAIRWACKHFHLYVYGHEFQVVTDHKPLVSLFAGSMRLAPPRIKRWAVLLQPYRFNVIYRTGVNNPADYMSRHPSSKSPEGSHEQDEERTEVFMSMVVESSCPNALTATEIGKATETDRVLTHIREALENRSWKHFLGRTRALSPDEKTAMQGMWRAQDELSIGGKGLVLRGRRIVLPQSLWSRVVELAHQSHEGAAKTKARLRAKVWFPGMDAQVDALIGKCHSCLITSCEPRGCPVITEPPSHKPWAKLSMDFGTFPDGRLTAVIIDTYNKFPVVEVLASTSFENVRPMLDQHSRCLASLKKSEPTMVPPFQGQEFKTYLDGLVIRHRRIMP